MMRSKEITNSDDIIDSRDVIARIEALQDERASIIDEIASIQETLNESISEGEKEEIIQEINHKLAEFQQQLINWDADSEGQELKALLALADEAEGYASDWKYGETLIRDSYFQEYAQELAEDIGAIPDNLQWPCTCIDWEQAARELKMDYTSVEFDGVTYWVR